MFRTLCDMESENHFYKIFYHLEEESMNTLFQLLFALAPVAILMGATALIARKVSAGKISVKKSFGMNLAVFGVIMVVGCMMAMTVFAADGAAAMTAAERAASNESMGLGLLAAALVTGLAGIGGGIAVAAGAPAAIAAASEDPKSFGKSLIFVALGESIALYGVVISILILNKLV